MKRIVLYDIDGKIPNLALMKISSFYKKLGYRAILSRGTAYIKADIYFAGTIFHNEKTIKCTKTLTDMYGSDINIGGSGINLRKRLPDEIDRCFPDYELYNHNSYSIGFLTRGCNNNCSFCLVPKKEGKLNCNYASFDDFVSENQKKVMLLDNSLLASDKSSEILESIIKRNYMINFSQTLDISYLNEDTFNLLIKIKSMNSRFTKPIYYFSCNAVNRAKIFYKKEGYLRKFGRDTVSVIIMFGYNTKLSEDYEILLMTKKLGLLPFVQEYAPIPGVPSQIPEDYFDMDLDKIAAIRFRTNGQNNEKFLRYVNKLHFKTYGKYYLPLLKAIYRYNNKKGINKYLEQPHLLSDKQYHSA